MTDDFRLHGLSAMRSATERNRRRNSQVTVITVHRDVWEAALRAANGDASRLVIVSPTEVIVNNRGRS